MKKPLEKQEERFAFGKNWQSYLEQIDNRRIEKAVQSLQEMLDIENLEGKRFLDIGCGSGLFSLAAHILGAEVVSFDYDPCSVAAATKMKELYAPDVENWNIMQGDVLNKLFLKSLGTFDIVYSWGVLHHTGKMWEAMENAIAQLGPSGHFFITLYNDQAGTSRRWNMIKKFYNRSPFLFKTVIIWSVILYFESLFALVRALRFQRPLPNWKKREEDQLRGMSVWHDYVDWVGGYPFEVAKPDDAFSFCKKRGLVLEKLVTVGGGHGCNEYVFSRGKM